MIPESSTQSTPATANAFTPADLAAILRERGWLDCADADSTVAGVFRLGELAAENPASNALNTWLAEAAALLGPHCADRGSLAELLRLIFHYDAQEILRRPESHVILAREGAREVLRELALLVLDGPGVDSDRFKEIISALKVNMRFRGRELFHPIRLALAGRAGEGELDRVILLLDAAARLPFRIPAKSTRARMLEFCTALE